NTGAGPIVWRIYPVLFRKKERGRDHDAADLEISGSRGRKRLFPKSQDAIDHRLEVRGTIHLRETVPGEPRWKYFEPLKESETCNRFLWRTQLEEEETSRGQGPEHTPATGLPEVDLIDTVKGPEVPIPVRVG
ncbi:MAG: hypothetical protein ACE5EO_13145, partial [Candidatus Krumholzibacteriia bacterium]